MIVDNLRVHHAKKVKEWEEENKDKIKLFYLPPYSPEFNPDEYLNQDYMHTPEQFGQPADLHPDTLPELIRTASRFIFGQF